MPCVDSIAKRTSLGTSDLEGSAWATEILLGCLSQVEHAPAYCSLPSEPELEIWPVVLAGLGALLGELGALHLREKIDFDQVLPSEIM